MLLCLQLWSYHYNNMSDPETARILAQARTSTYPQALGTLVHTYVSHWYAARGAAQPGGFTFRGELVAGDDVFLKPAAAVRLEAEERDQLGPTVEGVTWQSIVGDAVAAGRAYRARWEHEPLRVLGVEEQRPIQVRSPITGNVYEYDSRLDLEVETVQGVILRDFKTTGFDGGEPDETYSLDLQFLGMKRIGRKYYGPRFSGVSVEHVVVRGGRISVERYEPTPAPQALQDWALSLALRYDEVLRLQAAGVPPHRYPKAMSLRACTAWGGCNFRERCQRGPVDVEKQAE
jgi:hypothetical protein